MSRTQVWLAVSCAGLITACATPTPPRPEAVRTAQCMVDVLKAMPSTVEAEVTSHRGHFGEAQPAIAYTVSSASGEHFYRRVELYQHGGSFGVRLGEGMTRVQFVA